MIINNSVQRAYGINGQNKPIKPGAVSKVKASEKPKDTIALSGKAQDYAAVRSSLASVPDVREEKTAALAKLIESGNYNVSPRDIANKLLSEE